MMLTTLAMSKMMLNVDSPRIDSVTLCKYCLGDDDCAAKVFARRRVSRRKETDVIGRRRERIAGPSTPFSIPFKYVFICSKKGLESKN